MTKAENRAAAKAYHQERMRKLDEEARAADVAADLVELGRFRRNLIFGRRPRCRWRKTAERDRRLCRGTDRRPDRAAPKEPQMRLGRASTVMRNPRIAYSSAAFSGWGADL